MYTVIRWLDGWLDEKQMACDLLSFQGLQAKRRDSIPLRSTIKTVEISTVF